jgi:hypothetical protein
MGKAQQEVPLNGDNPGSAWRLQGARWIFLASIDASRRVPMLQWRWRAIAANGATWEGSESFPDAPACKADAASHGFVYGAGGADDLALRAVPAHAGLVLR